MRILLCWAKDVNVRVLVHGFAIENGDGDGDFLLRWSWSEALVVDIDVDLGRLMEVGQWEARAVCRVLCMLLTISGVLFNFLPP